MAEKPGNSNQGTAIKNHQSPAENTGISLNSGGGGGGNAGIGQQPGSV